MSLRLNVCYACDDYEFRDCSSLHCCSLLLQLPQSDEGAWPPAAAARADLGALEADV